MLPDPDDTHTGAEPADPAPTDEGGAEEKLPEAQAA